MQRVVSSLVICASLVAGMAGDAKSWGVISHYQITVEASTPYLRDFVNLPDSWPSHYGMLHAYGITEWFAWSHAVQRTGRTDGVPNVPRYPNDGRDPGKVMYELYLEGTGSSPQGYETALGFLLHNGQDRQVHYRYFRGGSKAAWREEHELKELWADCIVYQYYVNRDFEDRGFTGIQAIRLPTIKNKGNGGLISLAQKKFVDAGLSTDADGLVKLQQESSAEITERISKYEREISGHLKQFNKKTCDSYSKWVKNYDWTLDELQEYYEKSMEVTRSLLRAFPRTGGSTSRKN